MDKIIETISLSMIQDSVVRLKLVIRENLSGAINKGQIEKILYSYGAYIVSKILTDVIQTKIIKTDDILIHKNDFDLFEAYAKAQGMTEDMLKQIIDEARSIIK